MDFKNYVQELSDVLLDTVVTDNLGKFFSIDKGFNVLLTMCQNLKKDDKTLFFVGNGASAMMASHMATDFCKNGGIKSMAFNDASLMTAIGNDLSYEQCFAFPLSKFAQEGDVLATISSSGNSQNVIEAIKIANDKNMEVITLSGMKDDNKSRQMGDINFYVPGATYGLAECGHQVLLHCWFDMYMEKIS